jgi:hypothetical protein
LADSARVLLEGAHLNRATIKYLTVSGMLGYLMQGNKEESYRLWSHNNATLLGNEKPDLLFRLLVAESTLPE